MATLTKKDLAVHISEEMGFSVRESKRLVDAFFQSVKEFLKEGEDVKIVRFGTFSKIERASKFKEGTKETVGFHPSRWLKGRLNGGKKVLQD
ncbi:HU family DNA-binding protein [Dissulfuribacter thermophilus]|uniref:HU family DNA-binding protein n=1 Tax=Dissulfuribacter thermophilus TaxID=1156395 RepID=UPI00082A92B0|nr:HU family DNA-binding protein [Dissulfuribacter thermophilus]